MTIRFCQRVSALVLPLLIAGILTQASQAAAQSFPSQSIRIVVPASAGTPPDIISRLVAAELSKKEGWRVIVENKIGAMQMMAGAEVLKQPADGHTMVAFSLPSMVAPHLLQNMTIQLEADFVPVIKVATSYNVLVVHPSVQANSVSELVTLLKSNPDKLTFSSGGFGTPAHLAGELFKVQTGVRATHVPYQQFPQAIADLLGGTNQYMFINTLPVIDLISTGKLRALAVTAPRRIAALKDVPTVVESGHPDLVVQDWAAYFVKKDTPKEIVAKLNDALNQVLAQTSVQDAFAKLGAEPAGGTTAELGSFVGSQLTYWAKVVKASGMKMHQ